MVRAKKDLLSPGVLDDVSDGSLAEKLMLLFETRLSPDLDPFTLLEVAEGTGGNISPTYLMNLRDGKFSNPSMSKIKALSKFFGVPITYFYDEEGADTLREEIRNDFFKSLDALSDAEVRRQIAESTTPRAQSIIINIVRNKRHAN